MNMYLSIYLFVNFFYHVFVMYLSIFRFHLTLYLFTINYLFVADFFPHFISCF